MEQRVVGYSAEACFAEAHSPASLLPGAYYRYRGANASATVPDVPLRRLRRAYTGGGVVSGEVTAPLQ